LIVTEHVPAAAPVVAVVQVLVPFRKVASPLVVKATTAPPTRFCWASFTVALADEVVVPSAGTDAGVSATATVAGAPGVSVRVAVPDLPPLVAVIVSTSAVVEAWITTVQVPAFVVMQVSVDLSAAVLFGNVTSPLRVKVTGALATLAFVADFTVAVADPVEAPSAVMVDGLSARVTV
jgi:hypothetical protein